jgi:hypothetical protein
MLKEIALSSYCHGWFSISKLRSVFHNLAVAVRSDVGEYSPSWCLVADTS